MIFAYYDAVRELVGNENLIGGNINGPLSKIEFVEGFTNLPTEEQIQAKLSELQAKYDAQEYARNRSSKYPTWQEQMDMQYWDAKNGTNTWQAAIEAVKTKYPKGE